MSQHDQEVEKTYRVFTRMLSVLFALLFAVVGGVWLYQNKTWLSKSSGQWLPQAKSKQDTAIPTMQDIQKSFDDIERMQKAPEIKMLDLSKGTNQKPTTVMPSTPQRGRR